MSGPSKKLKQISFLYMYVLLTLLDWHVMCCISWIVRRKE